MVRRVSSDETSEFLEALRSVAFDVAEEAAHDFAQSYPDDWPEEEHVTSALLQSLAKALATRRSQTADSLELRFRMVKRKNEAANGCDAIVRFRCAEPQWTLSTFVLLQAKRQEPGRSIADRDHVQRQFTKMLPFTSESFVMIYSVSEGVCFATATAGQALGSADLFDLRPFNLAEFTESLFCGAIGDPVAGREPPPDLRPKNELLIELYLEDEEPLRSAAAAG